jgi:TonB family protein
MMFLTAALLLAAAHPAAAPDKHPRTPAVPLPPEGEVADPPNAALPMLFSTEDYPPSALRSGEQGTVTFLLKIGVDGLVKDCSIAESSGSPILDSTTCRLLTTRARFSPARNARRKPVEDTYRARIRWVLPDDSEDETMSFPGRATAYLPILFTMNDYPKAAIKARHQGTTTYRLSIGPDGAVTGCTIVQSSGWEELDSTTCRILRERARFNPARNAAGEAIADEYHGRARWVLP